MKNQCNDRYEPIFIVGAPRSGTTLLAALLSGHSRIACGPETHFFNKIGVHRLRQAVRDCSWPNKAVDTILSLTLAGQKVNELFEVSDDEIQSFLSNCKPSIQAMLESLTALYAQKSGKLRWAEKTPNHLLFLKVIRQEFLNSPIIRIIRDPRDSAISITQKLPWASKSLIANCYLWDEWFQKSNLFFERDRLSLTICYENLVLDPVKEMKRICYFIGEDFEQEMLDTTKTSKYVSTPKEAWKSQVANSLTLTRTFVWQKELSPNEQNISTFCCYAGIEKFGYKSPVKPSLTIEIYPPLNRASLESFEDIFIQSAEQGIRFVQVYKLLKFSHLTTRYWLVTINFSQEKLLSKHFIKTLAILLILGIRRGCGLSNFYFSSYLEKSENLLDSVVVSIIKRMSQEYSSFLDCNLKREER